MAAAFITTKAFASFTPRNLKMLRQFLSKSASVAFFDIGTYRIQAPRLLFSQFTAAKIFGKNFRIVTKFVKYLSRHFVNSE